MKNNDKTLGIFMIVLGSFLALGLMALINWQALLIVLGAFIFIAGTAGLIAGGINKLMK